DPPPQRGRRGHQARPAVAKPTRPAAGSGRRGARGAEGDRLLRPRALRRGGALETAPPGVASPYVTGICERLITSWLTPSSSALRRIRSPSSLRTSSPLLGAKAR